MHRTLFPTLFPTLAILLLGSLAHPSIGLPQDVKCPKVLLFTNGQLHFYSTMECEYDETVISACRKTDSETIYIYDHEIITGCVKSEGANECECINVDQYIGAIGDPDDDYVHHPDQRTFRYRVFYLWFSVFKVRNEEAEDGYDYYKCFRYRPRLGADMRNHAFRLTRKPIRDLVDADEAERDGRTLTADGVDYKIIREGVQDG